MNKHSIRLWLILGTIGILTSAIVVQAAPPSPPSIDLCIFGGGATQASSGSYALVGTIGQVSIGSSNGAFRMEHGFWSAAAEPVFRVNLPAVLSD